VPEAVEDEWRDDISDERLELIFTCCHPSLGSRRRSPDAARARRSEHGGDRRAFLVPRRR
jgi:predicted RNA polymerase sigma factor